VHPVVTGARSQRPVRPAARSLGAGWVLLVCAAALAPTAPFLDVPAPSLLVALIALAGLALVVRLPGSAPVALAVAGGAAVPLVAAAAFSEFAAPATVAGGAALAVAGVSGWRLRRLREWAPWYGTTGVLVATAAALALLAAWGVAVVWSPAAADGLTTAHVAGSLEWAVPTALLVAAGGWLRPGVTVGLLLPSVLQVGASLLD